MRMKIFLFLIMILFTTCLNAEKNKYITTRCMLFMHEKPNAESNCIEMVSIGKYKVLDFVEDKYDNGIKYIAWYQIKYAGSIGWISGMGCKEMED